MKDPEKRKGNEKARMRKETPAGREKIALLYY